MIAAFLRGLLLVAAKIFTIVVAVISGKWLVDIVRRKLKNRKKHKVVFADTREVVDDYIKSKVANSKTISMDELERICSETPYVAAVIDEYGEISEYEGFKGKEYNENFKARMKQQKGMIIVEA